MNHILVPVDLSRNSKVAVRYAGHLAQHLHTDLTIIYCYTLLQKAVSYTIGQPQGKTDPDKWIEKRIAKLKKKHPDLVVDYRIVKENVVETLQKMVNAGEADLVVMGAQGLGENESTFLGSTAGAMVKTTEVPVLLVPSGSKFKGIDKIVFAAKNTFVKFMGPLDPIIQIKQAFKPHIQLLHLGEQPDPIPEQSFSILPVINDITRYGNDNFNESINEYLSQYHADLLCVIRRKRGFLEKLLGPSSTSSSKFNVDIPVLVLIGEDY